LQAFFLYDSKGFPLDLTQRMAEEAGLTVDVAGYNRCMEAQREMGRKARAAHAVGRNLVLEAAQTAHLAETLKVAPTVDAGKYVWFQKPVATVKAIYTPAGFLSEGQAATPDNEVVRKSVCRFVVDVLFQFLFCCGRLVSFWTPRRSIRSRVVRFMTRVC
jgi:alanyl-tRNA synthetase